MLNQVCGRKFELHPVQLKESQTHCTTCGGTKWMLEDEKWLVRCGDCCDGTIKLCSICDKPIPRSQYAHPGCNLIREAKAEAGRFEKAEKVEPDSDRARSFGMMYSEAIGGYEDAYFVEWDEFFGKWHDNDGDASCSKERPEYVWGTTSHALSLDAYAILENALDDFYEGASDNIGQRGYDALQEVLDEWVAQYGDVTSYDVDYKVAVRIPWEDDDYSQD